VHNHPASIILIAEIEVVFAQVNPDFLDAAESVIFGHGPLR
jgi:hypothetical protein